MIRIPVSGRSSRKTVDTKLSTSQKRLRQEKEDELGGNYVLTKEVGEQFQTGGVEG